MITFLIVLGFAYFGVMVVLAILLGMAVMNAGGFEEFTQQFNLVADDDLTSINMQWIVVLFVLFWPYTLYEAVQGMRETDS